MINHLPVERQYRSGLGADGREVISGPQAPKRIAERQDTAAGAAILAKPELDGPGPSKIARFVESIKTAGWFGKPTAAPAAPSANPGMVGRDQVRAFQPQNGPALHYHAGSGQMMMRGQGGGWSAPQRGSAEAHVRAQAVGGLSAVDRMRFQSKMTGQRPGRLQRFGAAASDGLRSPLGMHAAMIGAPLLMHALPGGHDEYGQRRSFAQTTAGQVIGGIGVPLAAMALPSMLGRGGMAARTLMGGRR